MQHMMLVVQLAIIINMLKMKRFSVYFFIYLFFSNLAIGKISINSQKSLINSNIIHEEINCDKLSELIGGLQESDLLWLGNLKGEKYQFALINTRTKENAKIYYLCGNINNLIIENDDTIDVLRDRNLIKIFYDPKKLFTYIFSITSQESREYIQTRLSLKDFSITTDELMSAYIAGLTQINSTIIEKEPKKTKPKKIVKKPEPKITKDQNPPVLKIASTFTFSGTKNQINGEVSDKDSKKIYVRYKDDYGQEKGVDVIDGKFTFARYSPVSEELLIIATDTSGNEVKEKIKINIIIKKVSAEFIDRLDPSTIKQRNYPNRVALIIGIENYLNAPKASYANRDAKHFYEYAKRGFGISEDNIKLLVDEDATAANYYEALSLWLPSRIKPNVTELIVFYSGHGLATPDGKELYLLAHNSKTAFKLLPRTALMRTELFDEINNLKPKSVTMFFDTCFSGTSRADETLLADAKPINILSSDAAKVPKNFVVFSSSLGNQISSGFKEAKNGLFSYYLMKGLEGKADSNNDRRITNGELEKYLNSNISKKASEIGRSQNSQLVGHPNDNYTKKVLMVYK